jgi:hypothetical protein
MKKYTYRPIFGPKREEVTGAWKKLHSEELHNCTLPHKSFMNVSPP